MWDPSPAQSKQLKEFLRASSSVVENSEHKSRKRCAISFATSVEKNDNYFCRDVKNID